MASNSEYNALIKSMPGNNAHGSGGTVKGKLLLTDLNFVPPKWTILFRGQYLSRDVNMAKLLCSPEDPIIIYKEKVKPPSFPFIVQIDYSGVTRFEENGNISLEVKALDSVGNLRGRISTELGKPFKGVKLVYNDRVLENYESLQDCKIVKEGSKISAKIEETSKPEKLKEFLPRISITYRVCLGGNKAEDKEKIAFFAVRKDKSVFKFEKRKGRKKLKELEIKSREVVIEAMNYDTVDILKRRICAVFKVDPEMHSIFINGGKLMDLETLKDQKFQEGETIDIDSISSEDEKQLEEKRKEELNQERQKESEQRLEKELEMGNKLEKEMETCSEENKLECKVRKRKRRIKNYKVHGIDDRCGGGGGPSFFLAQDVDRNAIKMNGETPTHEWNLYSFGMTLYGTCSNKQCISRKKKFKNDNGVSHIAGYGNIILTPERNQFHCSACKEMFPVKEFVLCGGRALFRFKKSGVGQPVKTVAIESEYDLVKYATFDKTEKGKGVKMSSYDFIEITTVKPWCGLYTCVGCDGLIRFKQDENVLRCGHAYHNECTPVNVDMGSRGDGNDSDSTVGCYACDSGQLQSVYDMLGMDRENLSSNAALVRPF